MSALHHPEVRDLLAAAGLDPDLAEQPQADGSLAMGLHLVFTLGERLGLDLAAQGALLHYLRRIDALEQQLRALHAPASQRGRMGSLDRPTPWHEPHG
ncbi:hypothetical protein ACPWT1_08475 [Ramlibacter sp. MMS24-I3-19]|uniref:hypothetical protein n=1 Tax=Ramlibacter sp. MMS24-I3-19 TaxID=3416606 RepID=UPI003D015AEC